MKKTIVLLLTFVLILALTACGSNNNNNNAKSNDKNQTTNNGSKNDQNESASIKPESGASLTVWEEATEKPFVEEVGKAFKEKYGVDVKVEVVAAPDQADRLANDGPANLGADVVMFPHDKLGNAVNAGLLLPNDVFEQATKDSNPDAAIQASTYNGTLYGYPKSIETYALFYNKDLVKDIPKSWDDIIAFSKTFTDKAKKKFGIMWEVKTIYYDYMFLGSKGGYMFGSNGTDVKDIGLNNDGAVEGIKFMQSLHDILPVKMEDISWDVKTQLFQEGKLAFNIDGPWAISSFKDKVNYGVLPLPELPGGTKSISYSGVRSYYVNSYTKYPNAAKLFANFITDKENALANFKATGILPANKEASADPAIANDPILSGFVEQFKNSQPMPSLPEVGNVWTPMEGAFSKIWNKNADVKTSLDQAVKTIEEQISSTTKK